MDMAWVGLLAIGIFSLPGFIRTLFTNGFRGLQRPIKCDTESKQITLCRVI